jgi:hypothetical protein
MHAYITVIGEYRGVGAQVANRSAWLEVGRPQHHLLPPAHTLANRGKSNRVDACDEIMISLHIVRNCTRDTYF